jgi:anti-sigma factor RsiW
MTTPSFREVEQLSAFLDGQLSPLEKKNLEARLHADPALRDLLGDLTQARQIARRTPQRSVPRNFTLTPKMAGIRPPLPRLVPALSWASAVAALLFFITLGGNLLGQSSFSAAAPMLVAAPMTSQGSGLGGGEAATQPPASDNTLLTPTQQTSLMVPPAALPPGDTRSMAPAPTPKAANNPLNLWLFVWLALAALLIVSALLIRWLTLIAFRRKISKK